MTSPLPLPPYVFCLNAPAPPEIYTLSLHDALPIYPTRTGFLAVLARMGATITTERAEDVAGEPHADLVVTADRKSTRLNSSHMSISYAVFCLKKKKSTHTRTIPSPAEWRPSYDSAC